MDGRTPETCAECGFDARAWARPDAATVLDALGLWWRLATADIEPDALNRRPRPGVWSALEYGSHSALVTAVLRAGLEQILAADGCRLPTLPDLPDDPGAPAALDPPAVLEDLRREGHALAALTRIASPEAWANVGHLPDQTVQAQAALLHAVHDATHHQLDVGRGLAAIGAGTPAATGTIVQVNASNGGVPKQAVPRGWIGPSGLDGDHHADRRHHGRPFQALCVWSLDVIDELVGAGHPIGPGCAGENLTLAGLDWSTLRPGARLRVG